MDGQVATDFVNTQKRQKKLGLQASPLVSIRTHFIHIKYWGW